MRIRHLAFICLIFGVLYVGITTGVLANAAMFLTFGISPNNNDTLDPTIMLGLHAVLLILIGYCFGYAHGALWGDVRCHLKHSKNQSTQEMPQEQPVKTSKQKRSPREFIQKIDGVKTKLSKNINKLAILAMTTRIASTNLAKKCAHTAGPVAKNSWKKFKPYIARTGQIIGSALIKILDFIFTSIERVWLWFRP